MQMKRSRLNLLSVIALGGVMACGPMVRAQDTATPPPPAQGGDNPTAPAPNRGAALQDALAKLNLTPEEQLKVKAVFKEQREKMTALRDDTSLTPQERRPKMKEITDATDAKLKTILTPDQYAKWETVRPRTGRPVGAPGAGGANTNKTAAAPN
jgi:periplasmic protein CpxP/Spy